MYLFTILQLQDEEGGTLNLEPGLFHIKIVASGGYDNLHGKSLTFFGTGHCCPWVCQQIAQSLATALMKKP